MFSQIVLEVRSNSEITQDLDNGGENGKQQLDEKSRSEQEGGKNTGHPGQGGSSSGQHNVGRKSITESLPCGSSLNDVGTLRTGSNTDMPSNEANMAKFLTQIGNLKQQYREQFKTKFYQIKNHRTNEDNLKEVSRDLYDSQIQPVLDRIKLAIKFIEDQSKTLNLWEIVHLVNPHPIIEYDREELVSEQGGTLVGIHSDRIFRWGIVLCCIFEELMMNFGWKVGDKLDIEKDICDIVGQLMMEVAEQDRASLLDCMQSAIMNIQAYGNKQDDSKLKMLLITKKKYNGLNLACILLEQMILDNKDNNVSWMRIVCTQFIDLVCQLIIEPDYREDVRWTLGYFVKLESAWSIQNIYNLIRNGLHMFHCRQDIFYRYLKIIRNFAIHPSVNVCLSNPNATKSLECLLNCRDEDTWRLLNSEVNEEEKEKSLDQVLKELMKDEVGHNEQHSARLIIENSQTKLINYKDDYAGGIERELERIHNSEQKDGIEVLSSCLAATSMALYICNDIWALNTQRVSYCLLVARGRTDKGRLLEILAGEGKSCVIAMVAATYALLGRTVDIVTSSPVLSQRYAEEWRAFYKTLGLDADCNVENISEEDSQCYNCPIVYGTVETFARDILKTKFVILDVRKRRSCDIVIVDEVDSMLIDQGVQCTYLSHDLASIWMSHFEPIMALIWMHVSRLITENYEEGIVRHVTEPEVFLVTLYRLNPEIDPLQILRLAENDARGGIKEGFTDKYRSAEFEDQKRLLRDVDVDMFFDFAWRYIRSTNGLENGISIVTHREGLASIVFSDELMKQRLRWMIIDVLSDESDTKIGLPSYLKKDCISRLADWIDNAFLVKQMKYGREYIVKNNAIYPVDCESGGVLKINKKWGEGLQQFLEMKHGLPFSPLSRGTNFLSNIDFFKRYGNNILGVSGTVGNVGKRKFMDDTFSLEFATIPTSKRWKAFEIDGHILKCQNQWEDAISKQVESATASERAVLILCGNITTAEILHTLIASRKGDSTINVSSDCSGNDKNNVTTKVLMPRDVVITTNLGARGSNYVTDDIVNKNGGLFVLVTFIPLNDCFEKQAFGRTGRRGATGSCQILVIRDKMIEWLRLCETVDEAKLLRDSIEMRRLNRTAELNMTSNKHALFREYSELKE